MLIAKAREFKNRNAHVTEQHRLCAPSAADLERATTVLLKTVQKEVFTDELRLLKGNLDRESNNRSEVRERKQVLKKSRLRELDPFVDENGVLRVGGRLRRSSLDFVEKHPAILPRDHYLSELLVRHYHETVHHQGRQITHGAVRQAGYWIVSGHRVVTKLITTCVTCKKSRGATLTQHMADSPEDRTEPSPPFTNVGLDVFGPWSIRTRKLRGGAANSKRWGLLFTCLSTRAIHIEALESMDASAFICALRRFFAIRGPVTRLRSDRGTNFVGGKSELQADGLNQPDQEKVQRYTTDQGCEWIFNPPHASHFGGV
jgi:hypothetical protein